VNGVDQGFYSFEEKIAKELLEKNNLSGGDIIKSKNDWDNQYSSESLLYDELSYLDVRHNSKKNIGQLLKWQEVYSADSYDDVKKYLDINKFAKNDALRALLFDIHGYGAGGNQKLLYNTSNGKFSPIARFESRLSPIIIDPFTRYWFDQELSGITKEYTNKLLNNLIQNDEYRIKRNEYLYELIQNKPLILEMFDSTFNKVKPIVLADNTNQAPGQQFIYFAKQQRKILSTNFDILKKYIYYNKAYTNLREIGEGKYILEISPDSNAPVQVLDMNIGDVYPIKIKDIKNNKFVKISSKEDLISFFKNKEFVLGMDNMLAPKKNTYKYEIATSKKVDNFDIAYQNTITKRKVEKRDNYSLLIKKPENFYTEETRVLSIGEFLNNPKLPLSLDEESKSLTLPHGVYKVGTNIVLPYGYNLTIEPGTKIKIAQDKSILVYGGLTIAGTKEKPVIIENLEKNKPFGVVGAIGDNTTNININYLNLSGGKEATINGAYLSGGLSLYSHKKVTVKNSHIHHNSADDGLNIKNADVILENNIFNANLADQVDLDVCKGQVTNNKFIENTLTKDYDNIQIPQDDNGDGLDFSGSQIIVKNNYYKGFLDKGISVGENTKALITNNEFQSNRSAITVKDQSDIYLSSNKYNNNKINIEMYQKKQIFNHPSVYNIDEKHPKDKIKKAKKSHYYKTNENIKLNDIEQLTIFNDLKIKNWIEYE